MTKNSQNRTMKSWLKVLLRLTLPIVWIFLIICLGFTLAFLLVPCGIAAFISWAICGDKHAEYTMVWCVFPWFILDEYDIWLENHGVLKRDR